MRRKVRVEKIRLTIATSPQTSFNATITLFNVSSSSEVETVVFCSLMLHHNVAMELLIIPLHLSILPTSLHTSMKAMMADPAAVCILTVSDENMVDNAFEAGEPPNEEHSTVILSCKNRMLPLPSSFSMSGIDSNASVMKGRLELAYVKKLMTLPW